MQKPVSRRRFLESAGGGGLAPGAGPIAPSIGIVAADIMHKAGALPDKVPESDFAT